MTLLSLLRCARAERFGRSIRDESALRFWSRATHPGRQRFARPDLQPLPEIRAAFDPRAE